MLRFHHAAASEAAVNVRIVTILENAFQRPMEKAFQDALPISWKWSSSWPSFKGAYRWLLVKTFMCKKTEAGNKLQVGNVRAHIEAAPC